MRGLKILFSTTALLAGLALAPSSPAQLSINIGVQPSCQYGYYGYEPYGCAPMGYYGAGYFYNGIFVGMGPWAGWGYEHGWGSHRFNGDGGGRYHGGVGRVAYKGSSGGGREARAGSGAKQEKGASSHVGGTRPSPDHKASNNSAPRSAASHGGQAHPTGGQAHGGGISPHNGSDHK
ncbi:MAG TPA: hypothetical protein VK716_07935 [Terracidiphilus sp.]|jgi:hypothetical protein|nr:hypothetical protein [Terracidiphilus sp.]